MKQEILALLIAKFSGVSEQVLGRIAINLAKTAITMDQVTTAVGGVTIQTVIESYADSRATEATESSVINYEKKHNLKDGKAIGGEPTTEPTGAKGSDDAPPWAQALINSNKVLSDKVQAMEGAKITDTRKQRFEAVIANLPEDRKSPYKRTSIDSLKDEEFEALITDVTAEVGVIEAGIKATGSVFTRPVGGGSSNKIEASESELNAAVEQLGIK